MKCEIQQQQGFTLVELMIVVAIIGIIAAIAYPSYQRYVIKTKRADAMTELQNIASKIEDRKLSQSTYASVSTTDLSGSFPRQGTALYSISLPTTLSSSWTITATPVTGGQMASDGTLTLSANGQKCRNVSAKESYCGMADEWKN